MSQYILGVDPGVKKTGWAIITHDHHQNCITFVTCGVISPKTTIQKSQKYEYIFTELSSLIQKYHPSVIAIETQFVGRNPQSAITLGMIRGIVFLAASLQKIPIFEYAPKQAKQAASGSGCATKSLLNQRIKLYLKISSPISEDESDALALAITHANRLKPIVIPDKIT